VRGPTPADDIQAAEVVVRLLDRGEVGVAVVHIEPDRQQRVSVFLDEIVECGGVAGGCRDLVAALQRRYRPLSAEPA